MLFNPFKPASRRVVFTCTLLLGLLQSSCTPVQSIKGFSPSKVPVKSIPLSTKPVLRLNTEMHTAKVTHVDVDAKEKYLVTGSLDNTARVWSLDGELVRVLRLPMLSKGEAKLSAVTISPDGETVAVGIGGQFNAIYLFNRKNGKLQEQLWHDSAIHHLAYSHNGDYLAASLGGGKGTYIYRTLDYAINPKEDCKGNSYWADFNPLDNKLVTTCDDGYARLYDDKFELQHQYETQVDRPPLVASFSPKGNKIALSFQNSAQINVLGDDLKLLYSLDIPPKMRHRSEFYGLAWSSDEHWLYAGGVDRNAPYQSIVRWSYGGQGGYDIIKPISHKTITGIQALQNGSILYGAADPTFGILNANGEKTWRQISDVVDFQGKNLLVSSDGSRIQLVSKKADGTDKHLVRFSISDRQLTLFPKGKSNLTAPRMQFSEVTNWKNSLKPQFKGKSLPLASNEISRSFAMAPGEPGKQSVLLGTSQSLRLFDKRGKQQWQVPVAAEAWRVNIPSNGRVAVAALGDGTLHWYRLRDGEELFTLLINADGKRWLLWSPGGYYMASIGGEELSGWQNNWGEDKAPDFFSVTQLRDGFYRPDMIRNVLKTLDPKKALQLANQKIGGGQPVNQVGNIFPPVIELLGDDTFSSSRVALQYKIRETSGKATTGITVLLNGRPWPQKYISFGQNPLQKGKIHQLSLASLPKEDINISVVVENPYTTSEAATLSLRWYGEPAKDEYRAIEYGNVIMPEEEVNVSLFTKNRYTTIKPSPLLSSLIGYGGMTTFGTEYGEPTVRRGAKKEVLTPIFKKNAILVASNSYTTLAPAVSSLPILYAINDNPTPPLSEHDVSDKGSKGTLYVLAMGVSDYKEEGISKLTYPPHDAEDMKQELEKQQDLIDKKGPNLLYKEVTIKGYSNPTTEIMIRGLEYLENNVTETDTAIIFFAGHGVNIERRYFFLPTNADVTDYKQLKKTGLSYLRLKDTLSKLPGNVLLFLDSCHSGSIMDMTDVSNDLSGVKNSVVVFAASTGDQTSLEASDWANGAFSEAVMEGLSGEADCDCGGKKDGKVSFKELGLYVSQRVPELVKSKSHNQTPALSTPKAIADFDIVMLD
ncbi:caspase family protein [Candidatus Parabeggiatoa sp. HSG14]|uniref:caspase family protein n=1 Tax=Candidatus Parabeggiatoa sp. HSG14 TaxID=3055593 RepID=UPI0025A82A35|nr:caspase family protein [Thiotrichales bacterium HSG14]